MTCGSKRKEPSCDGRVPGSSRLASTLAGQRDGLRPNRERIEIAANPHIHQTISAPTIKPGRFELPQPMSRHAMGQYASDLGWPTPQYRKPFRLTSSGE